MLVLDADDSFTAEGPTDSAGEYHLQERLEEGIALEW